jgi:hypothetical protein
MIDPHAPVDTSVATERDGLSRYRQALRHAPADRLRRLVEALGPWEREPGARSAPAAIADRLAEPGVVARIRAGLGHPAQLALGLLALTEPAGWPAGSLALALEALSIDADSAVRPLLESGLLASWRPAREATATPGVGPEYAMHPDVDGGHLLVHPAALEEARTLAPEGAGPPPAGAVRLARHSDGLEPLLRLAALWQRVVEAPLRQTQQGALYKKDRERLLTDPAISGPSDEALAPLNDQATLWLTLGRAVELLRDEPGSDRIIAADPDFWAEHGVHLPPMIARRWLTLEAWREVADGAAGPGGPTAAALRLPALLWLARADPDAWVALEDLAAHLTDRLRQADRISPEPRRTRGAAPQGRETARWIEAALLGPAYLMGLVAVAEEVPTARRVVRLTPSGRYALGLGPAPAPAEPFEHFLYIQPNFEVIAYRQGLNPYLIGQLSRFARWTKLGAALHLDLTPELTYSGLEGGLTTAMMLERLGRHSARPVPPGVAEALRSWADRRERVTYHVSATLLEFATRAERDQAAAGWAGDPPTLVGDRLILVADAARIPFDRFRLLGSRDYRQAPDACVEVEPDGITLSLDANRSDLFVAAELTRFAEELPSGRAPGGAGAFRRRFRVTSRTIAHWHDEGLGLAELDAWFSRRTGTRVPPAVRLLVRARTPDGDALRLVPEVVLHGHADWLDGLAQHPETARFLGERLGPTAVLVARANVDALRDALAALGITPSTE